MTGYRKPQAIRISTTDTCEYGCGQVAKYIFANKKKCCSDHHNSCQGKRNNFSKLDHSKRTAKSLATRLRLGITKSSQIKGAETRKAQGHYKKLAVTMRHHWNENPWENNPRCPLVQFKETNVNYQGSYEYNFLKALEEMHGISWLVENVDRGPAIWYNDPITGESCLYISDFIIDNTIYEIKSHWTWNRVGTDAELELKNKAKLWQCVSEGYIVRLIMDGEEKEWQ